LPLLKFQPSYIFSLSYPTAQHTSEGSASRTDRFPSCVHWTRG